MATSACGWSLRIVLYNVFGKTFEIEPDAWGKILSLAREHGWQPAGTMPPPARLDLRQECCPARPWEGAYAPAEGQEVSREDALSLAEALEIAGLSRRISPLGKDRLMPRLAAFCRRGGFLICRLSDSPQTYRSAAEAAPAAATLECVSARRKNSPH